MREQPFPFWRLALSIATGMLIANAVTWFAAETRVRYELREADRAMQAEMRRLEAADIKRQQVVADAAARKREQQHAQDAQRIINAAKAAEAKVAEQDRYREAAERDAREGEYFRPATLDLAPGTFACKDRQIVKRTTDGWDVTRKGDGSPARCRIDP